MGTQANTNRGWWLLKVRMIRFSDWERIILSLYLSSLSLSLTACEDTVAGGET